MEHTLLWALGLFLLNTLLYGHAEDDGPVLEIPDVTLFEGDSVILRCKHHTSVHGMQVTFYRDGSPLDTSRYFRIAEKYFSMTASERGIYKCNFGGAESDEKELKMEATQREVTLRSGSSIVLAGGHVTLTCSVQEPSGFRYNWYRENSDTHGKQPLQPENDDKPDRDVSGGGSYTCRGWSGDVFTPESNAITIQEAVQNRAILTFQPNWHQIFSGEKITVKCEIDKGDRYTVWMYEWKPGHSNATPTNHEYTISHAAPSHSGEYSCKGTRDVYWSTAWSPASTLTVYSQRPKAELRADDRAIPVGGRLTLTCSVSPQSSGWTYEWTRGEETSDPLSTTDTAFLSNEKSVSLGGRYWCRGKRGEPPYHTQYSDPVSINNIMSNRAVVTLHPNWPVIYYGETVTLRCEIKDGGDTEWKYEWDTTISYRPPEKSEYKISFAYVSNSGTYRCRGRMKNTGHSSTDWSEPTNLTVSYTVPHPVLTVSPSWLSPGGSSVTLSCEPEHPSAGWRFYWYKGVPKLSHSSYSYELLPDSLNGTEQGSYVIHGQTHTAAYVCRAGRGEPVYYSHYSKPEFVWSAGFPTSPSVTVSLKSVQHFTDSLISLTCEGNSSEWRVRKFSEDDRWLSSPCSYMDTATGPICELYSYKESAAVYWCESESGEFSSAVNLTVQNGDIILLSPPHPVPERGHVSLSCKLRRETFVSNGFFYFYRNNILIQNGTRRELNITAVSKSDEGFYRCQHSQQESAQSWMSVTASRPENSSFFVRLIVGLVCGLLLIPLLVLVYRYRPSKDSCFTRSVQSHSTNLGSAKNPVANHDEALGHDVSQDVTYTLIELKNDGKKKKHRYPEESTVYSDVKTGTADDNLMYAQIRCHNEGKAKRNKGKSTPAPTEEALYSEVKPQTSHGNKLQ